MALDTNSDNGHLGLLWWARPSAPDPMARTRGRLQGLIDAFARHRLAAEPVLYTDEGAEQVGQQLLGLDGVLVWVDPVEDGHNRSRLDALLREVSAAGVWVSAHPDVILKLGTKEVLYQTRQLAWGSETYLYRSLEELREQLPLRLAAGGRRVLKPNRGNGGIGVWSVELANAAIRSANDETAVPGYEAIVRVQQATRGAVPELLPLGEFLDRRADYFDGTFAGPELAVDQAFQPRLAEGQIRCYLVQDGVAGFGQQLIRGLLPPPPADAGPEAAQPGPRIMYGADEPAFQALRTQLENEWLPAAQQILGIDTGTLPAIWDADFLYGPKTDSGEDTYVLNEINVSAVWPFPDQAIEPLARAAAARLRAARRLRA